MAEQDLLLKRYNQAVGEALELGIKVYYPGSGRPAQVTPTGTVIAADLGPWPKALGDLEREIREARGNFEKPFEDHLAEAFERGQR